MILLLGNGLLGSEIKRSLDLNKINYKQLFRQQFDLTADLSTLKQAFLFWKGAQVDTIINATGFTKVDDAEQQKEEAIELNAYGVNKLAQLCREFDKTLVHISTDFIFDGTHDVNHPYMEEDQPNPVNYYGYTKLLGEQMIKESGCNYLIIRSGKLYNQQKGFIFSILNKIKEETYVCGIKNQIFSPTNAFNLANQIILLHKNHVQGIYHITNTGYTSSFDLIRFMKDILKSTVRVDESFLYEQFSMARRPAMTVLSMRKLESLGLACMPSWQETLEYTIRNQLAG